MSSTPFSSMLLVLLASVLGSIGAVFLKLGAAELRGGFLRIFNVRAAAGVALYLGSSYFFVLGIRHGELSVLYPMVSLGYVLTALWSRIFFKEFFTPQKFVGLGLVLAGVVCVGLGSR